MGIEFKNVTMMTKEQHDAVLAANRTEQYRAIALKQEQQIAALKRKIKKLRKERKALVSDLKGYIQAANEYENDAVTLYQSLEKLTSAVEDMEICPPGGDSLDRACKAVSEAAGVLLDHSEYCNPVCYSPPRDSEADEIKGKSPTYAVFDELAQPIPHHGPGLSEAEDAVRPAGVVGEYDPALTQKQIAEAFGVIPKELLREDSINHPSHYQGDNGIECIDAIQSALTPEEFRGYCKGNVMKYTWRERTKQGDDSIRKARWYLNRMLGDE